MTANLDTQALRARVERIDGLAVRRSDHGAHFTLGLVVDAPLGFFGGGSTYGVDGIRSIDTAEAIATAETLADLCNAAPALLDAAEERDKNSAFQDFLAEQVESLQAERDALKAEVERLREALNGARKVAVAAVDNTECDGPDYHSRLCRRCAAQAVVDFLDAALRSAKGEVQS